MLHLSHHEQTRHRKGEEAGFRDVVWFSSAHTIGRTEPRASESSAHLTASGESYQHIHIKAFMFCFPTNIGDIFRSKYKLLQVQPLPFPAHRFKKGFPEDSSLFEYLIHKAHAQISIATIPLQKNFHSSVRHLRSLNISALTTATWINHGKSKQPQSRDFLMGQEPRMSIGIDLGRSQVFSLKLPGANPYPQCHGLRPHCGAVQLLYPVL